MGHIRYNIPDELHKRLKARAAMNGESLFALIVRYLTAGLEHEEES